jgi:hypothetical protein
VKVSLLGGESSKCGTCQIGQVRLMDLLQLGSSSRQFPGVNHLYKEENEEEDSICEFF